jgi:hypothetical protein
LRRYIHTNVNKHIAIVSLTVFQRSASASLRSVLCSAKSFKVQIVLASLSSDYLLSLCFPTFSHFLIVNKNFSLSLSLSLLWFLRLPLPIFHFRSLLCLPLPGFPSAISLFLFSLLSYPPAKADHVAKRRVGVEYSPSMLEPVRPGAVSPDRALCLSTFTS